MTLLQSWQYPEGYLEFVVDQFSDPPEVWAPTDGEHGYETTKVVFSYMPSFLTEDPYLRDLLWAMGLELDAVRAAVDSILGAFFVELAPEWALRLWEAFVGLSVAPGGITESQRRAAVMQELGGGPRTVPEFRTMLADYAEVDESQVFVTENFSLYTVDFVVQVGLTVEQDTLLQFLVRRFLPAHLGFTLTYGGFIAGVNVAGDIV